MNIRVRLVLMSNNIYQCSYRSHEDEGLFSAHVQQYLPV